MVSRLLPHFQDQNHFPLRIFTSCGDKSDLIRRQLSLRNFGVSFCLLCRYLIIINPRQKNSEY